MRTYRIFPRGICVTIVIHTMACHTPQMDNNAEGEWKRKEIVRIDTVLILDPETGEEQTRIVEISDTVEVPEQAQKKDRDWRKINLLY